MGQENTMQTYALVDARPTAIVVHCSDPRFQSAFRKFIGDELHLADGEYIPLVVSGGVASLSEPLRLPKEFKFMKERIELFLERFDSINRIILINHEDCRHYEVMKSLLGKLFLQRVQSVSERQLNDLRATARIFLNEALPGKEVELYYARLCGGDARTVVFDRVV